jgi:hypothetical protein
MKTLLVLAAAVLAASLGGCAGGMRADGRGMNGFPIDEKCADFYAASPIYNGNRTLAYSGNCVSVGM